jgi:hypothetical protein
MSDIGARRVRHDRRGMTDVFFRFIENMPDAFLQTEVPGATGQST